MYILDYPISLGRAFSSGASDHNDMNLDNRTGSDKCMHYLYSVIMASNCK